MNKSKFCNTKHALNYDIFFEQLKKDLYFPTNGTPNRKHYKKILAKAQTQIAIDDIKENFNREIRDVIEKKIYEKEFTQQMLASFLGLEKASFNRRLSGKIPFTYGEIRILCQILDIENC